MKIVIGIPVYNEEKILPIFLEELKKNTKFINNIEILVINDGSSDASLTILQSYNFYTLISNKTRQGLGSVISSMLEHCNDLHATHFILLPGNHRINSNILSKLVYHASENNYDLIKGSRFVNGGSKETVPAYKILILRALSLMIRRIFNFPITDITCSLIMLKLSSWEYEINKIVRKSEYSIEQIISIFCFHNNYKYKEIGLTFNYSVLRSYTHVTFMKTFDIIKPWVRYLIFKYFFKVRYRPQWLI